MSGGGGGGVGGDCATCLRGCLGLEGRGGDPVGGRVTVRTRTKEVESPRILTPTRSGEGRLGPDTVRPSSPPRE